MKRGDAERKHTGNSDAVSGTRRATRYEFTEDEFTAVLRKLRRKYPGEWVGMAILAEDNVRGVATGEVIAHSHAAAITVERIREYQEQHPGTPVRFFTTDMALARPFPG